MICAKCKQPAFLRDTVILVMYTCGNIITGHARNIDKAMRVIQGELEVTNKRNGW
jgi:hypothetical protein